MRCVAERHIRCRNTIVDKYGDGNIPSAPLIGRAKLHRGDQDEEQDDDETAEEPVLDVNWKVNRKGCSG